MASNQSRILLTTGDPDGIGYEVTLKALALVGPSRQVQYVLWRGAKSNAKIERFNLELRRRLSTKFEFKTFSSLSDAVKTPINQDHVLEIRSARSPAQWVEDSAKACLSGDARAMVTAPLSKTSIIESGRRDLGHTEILARVSGHPNLFMGFLGRKFNVLLATGHLPLDRALRQLTETQLTHAIRAAETMAQLLPSPRSKRPLALVGVNPHAGEAGLIGQTEIRFSRLLKNKKFSRPIEGPLVPDSAFLKPNWSKYSVYICPYHDQGLIPFKMIHGFGGGVHVTLGLPFVRTSVDHGTAKDIFGLNKADPGSMRDAILAAIRLSQETAK